MYSDTTDKDKSTIYFFIKHPYENIFKDGQMRKADEIISTDGPLLKFKCNTE